MYAMARELLKEVAERAGARPPRKDTSMQPLQNLSIRLSKYIHRLLHDPQIECLHMRVIREVNVRVPACVSGQRRRVCVRYA